MAEQRRCSDRRESQKEEGGDDARRRWTISRGNIDPFVLIVLVVLQASADAKEMEEGWRAWWNKKEDGS